MLVAGALSPQGAPREAKEVKSRYQEVRCSVTIVGIGKVK